MREQRGDARRRVAEKLDVTDDQLPERYDIAAYRLEEPGLRGLLCTRDISELTCDDVEYAPVGGAKFCGATDLASVPRPWT